MSLSTSLEDLSRLGPIVYAELRRAAQLLLEKERTGHTLQPTALVHEALLRLSRGQGIPTEDPRVFIYAVVREMRRELTDHARRARAQKRSWHLRSEAPEEVSLPEIDPTTVLSIDAALDKLQRVNPRAVALIEMRFFGGLTGEEIAAVMGVTTRTVERIWRDARRWLFLEMEAEARPNEWVQRNDSMR